MINRLYIGITCLLLISVIGCKQLSSEKENLRRAGIEKADNDIAASNKEKLDTIAQLAAGTDYALNKATNTEPATGVAKDLNLRVISLSGEPSLDSKKEIWVLVDKLTSDLIEERKNGIKILKSVDKRVQDIEQTAKERYEKKEAEMKAYMDSQREMAKKFDSVQAELSNYKGNFGLNAVIMGLKQFFFTSMWTILGIVIIFAVIRGFAATNPIASAILGLFEQVGSWFVSMFKVLLPKAVSLAGHIPLPEFNLYKDVTTKMVDTLQFLKEKDPDAKFTVDEICDRFKLDSQETSVVDSIKRELRWKR